MRYAAKIDANQPSIVSALRKIGASVLHLHTLGKGAPDILIAYRGRNVLLEIKDGSLPPSARALTPDEAKFHAEWRGELHIVHSVEDAIRAVVGG